MTLIQAQSLAHELTIEYVRKHSEILLSDKENIPNIVNTIADINRKFYDNIIHNEKFDGLY